MKTFLSILTSFACAAAMIPSAAAEPFVVVADSKVKAQIVVKTEAAHDAARWLAESLQKATRQEISVAEAATHQPSIILARGDQFPQLAEKIKFDKQQPEAYAIRHIPPHLYVLGSGDDGISHGVAAILQQLGFRWYNPNPNWWIVPELKTAQIETDFTSAPAIRYRRIYYTPSWTKDATLLANFRHWTIANRLTLADSNPLKVGHSYGGVVQRHQKIFNEHPEYFAAGDDGKPNLERKLEGRKFCTSNPELIKLFVADRIAMWEKDRQKDPANFMISADPSDGPGICVCPNCQKLGNETDRVVSLANHAAKGLREKHPEAWIGMYAYGFHLEPPTIPVEPNIYIQVAMGYNFTGVPLPELVDAWSKKVSQIGLREYYGIVGADWGLPGRVRAGEVAYHQKWIPYYAARKVNAINAQSDAFWGTQTLGFYTATQLMWNPSADVAQLEKEYYRDCFGPAANAMQNLQAKFDTKPAHSAAALLPLLRDLAEAYELTGTNAAARARVVDMMAYTHYAVMFAEFTQNRPERFLTKEYLPEDHDDAYYAELKKILEYLWQTRLRGMADVYAFAARSCDGYPRRDNRPEFVIQRSKKKPGEKDPIWMTGEQLTDEQVLALFQEDLKRLTAGK